jgi:hypothetical protein
MTPMLRLLPFVTVATLSFLFPVVPVLMLLSSSRDTDI